MPPGMEIGGMSVCLSVCISVETNFNLGNNFWTVRDSDFIVIVTWLHIWHAYSTNETLSNDTKVNDLVTLTFYLRLKKL